MMNWGSVGSSGKTLSASSIKPSWSANNSFNNGYYGLGTPVWKNPDTGQFSMTLGGNNAFGGSSTGGGGGFDWMGAFGTVANLIGAMQQSKLAKQQLELQRGAYLDNYNIASTNLANQKSALENSTRRLAESGIAQEYKPMGTDWSSMGDYYDRHAAAATNKGKEEVATLGLKEAGPSNIK
jgi:hypothetical protein